MQGYIVCTVRAQKKLKWIDTDFTQWVVDLNINKSTLNATSSCRRKLLHVGGGGGTGDNLNQFTGNGGLTLTVVQDLEPIALLDGTTDRRHEYTYLSIISPAFLEAFSMALRRAWSTISRAQHIDRIEETYRDLASMTLSHSPEEVVGQSVLTEAGQSLVVNLESGDVGCVKDVSI